MSFYELHELFWHFVDDIHTKRLFADAKQHMTSEGRQDILAEKGWNFACNGIEAFSLLTRVRQGRYCMHPGLQLSMHEGLKSSTRRSCLPWWHRPFRTRLCQMEKFEPMFL
jgi:hypothetical protein